MNLGKKKKLAVRTLGIGKERIIFLESRKDEIKEAITKQDIRDLVADGAIIIKNARGRIKKEKKRKGKGVGSIRKKAHKRKREYIAHVRKQRRIIKDMKKQGRITKEDAENIRKKIKNRVFKSAASLHEHLRGNLK